MIGNAVTSNSCMGTWRILRTARHAKATDATRADAGAGRDRVDRAARRVASDTAGPSPVRVASERSMVVVVDVVDIDSVLTPPPPPRRRRAPRPDAR